MVTYTIRQWDALFENSQSRKCNRLTWVPIPNKHDGKSYRRLIQMDDGPALYAAWVLMLQVASKCPTRGVLADDDGPLDADDLAAKTGCPADLFVQAFDVLASSRIGWLSVEHSDSTGSTVGACSQTATSTLPDHATVSSQKGMEQKGNKKESHPAGAGPSAEDFDEVVTSWNASGLVRCRKLTDRRRAALRKRLSDADWRDGWREALDRAAQSAFCRGVNDRGWRADIDWFLQPDSVTRLLEGKYDGVGSQRDVSASPDDVLARHTAEVLARKRAEQAASGGPV